MKVLSVLLAFTLAGSAYAVDATWSNYGAGWAGTNGIPTLTLDANPVIGTSPNLLIGNSLGAQTTGFLLLGTTQVTIPTGLGGSLELLPTLLIPLTIPATGAIVALLIPNNPNLDGRHVYLQTVQNDPGASHGVSFSQGVDIGLGDT